jgi:hypothetical protein
MSDAKPTFQQMNGCAACKHTSATDPNGKSAGALGTSYWCTRLGKGVDAKDGSACASWEYGG